MINIYVIFQIVLKYIMNPEYFMSLNIPDDLFNSSSDICNIYADLACISPSLCCGFKCVL